VLLWDDVRLRSDPEPDFLDCGSGSSQNVTDLPPWWAVSTTPLTTKKGDFIVKYLNEEEAIRKKALTHGSEAQMELSDEKN
jgi:hypothetical protein